MVQDTKDGFQALVTDGRPSLGGVEYHNQLVMVQVVVHTWDMYHWVEDFVEDGKESSHKWAAQGGVRVQRHSPCILENGTVVVGRTECV